MSKKPSDKSREENTARIYQRAMKAARLPLDAKGDPYQTQIARYDSKLRKAGKIK